MQTECDYLYGWIKKNERVTYAKISPKMVDPRDVALNAEEEIVHLTGDSWLSDSVENDDFTLVMVTDFCCCLLVA